LQSPWYERVQALVVVRAGACVSCYIDTSNDRQGNRHAALTRPSPGSRYRARCPVRDFLAAFWAIRASRIFRTSVAGSGFFGWKRIVPLLVT
jgi:hypothetical protein